MFRLKMFLIFCMLSVVLVSVSHAAPGRILSSFPTGEFEKIWGMDMRETSGGTELHVLSTTGQVFKFSVITASSVKDGSESSYDEKFAMFDPAQLLQVPMRGLALFRSSEGMYGQAYICTQNNRAVWRARWDASLEGEPGNLHWTLIAGAWQLRTDGGICPSTRIEYLNNHIWMASAEWGVIYRYPYTTWPAPNSWDMALPVSKPMTMDPSYDISLGDSNDIWVLCQDHEVLNISSTTGAIFKRFYIDSSIANPWGIAYDPSEKSIWIGNQADNHIYQVSTGVEPNTYLAADLNKDTYVNFKDVNDLSQQWLMCNDVANSRCEDTYGSPGEILSYFASGEAQLWGMSIRQAQGGTELHAIVSNGQVKKISINSVSARKDGAQGNYDEKVVMTDDTVLTANLNLHGLALCPTHEGASALEYEAIGDNLARYRSRWDVDVNSTSGKQVWTLVSGTWSTPMSGDIAPGSYTDPNNSELWGTDGNDVVVYSREPWVGAIMDPKFTLDKPLRSISLGTSGDLWVLTEDKEILNISANSGAVIARFFMSSTVTNPWGFAYDSRAKSLWVGDQSNNVIYQIATEAGQKKRYLEADLNFDSYVDFKDFAIFATQWMSCTDLNNMACTH